LQKRPSKGEKKKKKGRDGGTKKGGKKGGDPSSPQLLCPTIGNDLKRKKKERGSSPIKERKGTGKESPLLPVIILDSVIGN